MKETYKGYTINIEQDELDLNPRKEWNNMATIAMLEHRRYELGDKQVSMEEILSILNDDKYISLPIYSYEHGNISLSTGNAYPYNCAFDSAFCGVIFVEKEKVKMEWKKKIISKKLLETILNNLKAEISTYNQYLNGEVYYYSIVKDIPCGSCGHIENEVVDSLGGIFGYDEALSMAKSAIDSMTGKVAA